MAEAHLIVLTCDGDPRRVALSDELSTIGSGPLAKIRLEDPQVAPIHVEIQKKRQGFLLVRRETVWVNGRRASAQPLQAGDLIMLGRSALSFRLGSLDAEDDSTVSTRAEGTSLPILRCLYEFTRKLSSGLSVEEMTDQMLSDIVGLTGADRGMLVLFEGTTGVTTAGAKASRGEFDPKEMLLSRTAMAKIREERRPQLWTDIGHDADLAHAPSIHGARVRSLMAAPILVGDDLVGALYLSKSETPEQFDQDALDLLSLYAAQSAQLVAAASRDRELTVEVERAKRDLEMVRSSTLVGSSAPMQNLANNIRKVAQSTISVLILGETGTGKELIAREVHRQSDRADRQFVAVNCGAIPGTLLESELFGHVRGAFTGATEDRAGRIRSAHNGSLFLDEIGEMPLEQQAKLLRVLEQREVRPVGGDKSKPVDFRLICATNQELERRVAEGQFRRDLYYRIAGLTLDVPPLRVRGDDCIELANFFLKRQSVLFERSDMRLSAAAMTAIRNAMWEGNVRELEAAVRRALVLADDETILPKHLGLSAPEALPRTKSEELEMEILPLSRARDEYLKSYVQGVVDKLGGSRTAAAKALMCTPRTIFKYLEEV